MKIIDLLNKIANGEELPKKIKLTNGHIFKVDHNNAYYSDDIENDSTWLSNEFIFGKSDLNDEVEIIEEDKKIEKLEYNKVLHDGTEEADSPDEYYCEDCYIGIKGEDETNIRLKIINKINEIIDYINKEDNNEKA